MFPFALAAQIGKAKNFGHAARVESAPGTNSIGFRLSKTLEADHRGGGKMEIDVKITIKILLTAEGKIYFRFKIEQIQ